MLTDSITEVIFIGLPGPTHHYGGLSADNMAAVSNRGSLSNPKQAALQAQDLVRLLASLGIETAILPPQLRPHMGLLHQHFQGTDDEVIALAAANAPELLEKASSSSAMWAANAATVAPGVDSADGKLHITVANLHTNLHRRIEAEETYHTLQAIFKNAPGCEIHPPLFPQLRDEGAANHLRLSPRHSDKGLHVFIYSDGEGRQDLAASKAIAAQHNLPASQTVFIKQNPDIIREGVFHNDVIAVNNENVLLAHEKAYTDGGLARISSAYEALHPGKKLCAIVIPEAELSVEEAVRTYVFNSQIVTKPGGAMTIIAPLEVETLYDGKAAQLLKRIRVDITNPIDDIRTIDLRQSMRNGGGPACLRLRVPMNDAQLAAVKNHVNIFANEKLLAAITKLIETYYPDELSPQQLGDPKLYHQCKALVEELFNLMKLPLFIRS